MHDAESLLKALKESGGGPICQGQVLDSLDLRGRVLDVPLNLSGAIIQGDVDLSQAELRGGLIANRANFGGGFSARRCRITGDVMLSHARFKGPADLSWAHVRGRVYAWRARFLAEATFRQLIVSPGGGIESMEGGYVWPGEANFSWARFQGKTVFERCYLEGPVYFWRTRFLEACSFDETSFGSDATFMGKPSEISLSRDEIGWEFFDRLTALGLIRGDDEEVISLDGREIPMFGQLKDVNSLQELGQRMAEVSLSEKECQVLEALYREHAGPMFAKEASLQRLRIVQPRQVKFIAVNGQAWNLAGTDVNSIAFFNADQAPVPVSVGLGRAYERVFISYGGPDQMIAERFNRALQNVGVDTFYYPEDSIPGRSITEEMKDGVSQYDRVLLLCSLTSPERPGWRFELQRAMERERQQGSPALIIAAVDDGLWTPWPAEIEPARRKLLERTVADFRGALDDEERFNNQLARVLTALRKADPPA